MTSHAICDAIIHQVIACNSRDNVVNEILFVILEKRIRERRENESKNEVKNDLRDCMQQISTFKDKKQNSILKSSIVACRDQRSNTQQTHIQTRHEIRYSNHDILIKLVKHSRTHVDRRTQT